MKTLYSISKIAAVVVIVSLTFACEEISNPEPIDIINEEKTATIEGIVYANLDETNDTTGTMADLEFVPSNTTIKVILDSEDFIGNPQPGLTYQNLTYTTTVGSGGAFSIEVPALDEPINAEVYANNFTATQTQADSTTQTKRFSPNSFPYNVTIVADLDSYVDIVYQAN